MAATAQEKAYNLKDNYVADLVDKGKKDTPVLPETKHGDVALEPITSMIGLTLAAGAALHFTPELNKAIGSYDYLPRGSFENDKKNRIKSNIKDFTGLGDYDSTDFNHQHFDKTGEIKPYTSEQKRCLQKHSGGYPEAYCDFR